MLRKKLCPSPRSIFPIFKNKQNPTTVPYLFIFKKWSFIASDFQSPQPQTNLPLQLCLFSPVGTQFMLKPVMIVNSLCLLISGYAFANNKSAPMQKLSWLLDEWTFVNEQVNGEYWEKSSRNCFTVLHEQYIRCESFATSNKG